MNSTPIPRRNVVADGDSACLRIVKKINWIGKALVFPRALLRRHWLPTTMTGQLNNVHLQLLPSACRATSPPAR